MLTRRQFIQTTSFAGISCSANIQIDQEYELPGDTEIID